MDSFNCTVTIIADMAVALPKAYTRSVCRASDFVQTLGLYLERPGDRSEESQDKEAGLFRYSRLKEAGYDFTCGGGLWVLEPFGGAGVLLFE